MTEPPWLEAPARLPRTQDQAVSRPPGSAGLAAAFDWLPLAVLILAADGSAAAVNAAWTELSLLSAGSSLGTGWLAAVDPLDRMALHTRLQLAAAAGEPGSAECVLVSRSGQERVRWWWRPGPDGGLIACVAAAGDQPGVPPGWQQRPATPAEPTVMLELSTLLFSRISAAGLSLASAASVADGPAAARIHEALRTLDTLARDFRAAMFTLLPQPGEP